MSRARRILYSAGSFLAVLLVVASFAAAGLSLADRGRSVNVTCDQVKKLRTDLVAVLTAAADTSKAQAEALPARKAADLRRRVDAFYRPQLDRVRPVRCP